MSKTSDLAMQLDEHAVSLGYEDRLGAFADGYEWSVDDDGTAYLYKVEDEQDKAHEAWLAERNKVLGDLMNLMVYQAFDHTIVERAYLFIKERCHD